MDGVLNGVLALLLAVMLMVIAAQVCCRFILNNPLDWSEELGRYLFVWLSFLGAAVGVKKGIHLGVDVILKRFPESFKKVIDLLMALLIQVFLCMVCYYGIQTLSVVRFQSSPSMGISMLYPYLAVPVGCVFMFINSIRVTCDRIRGAASGKEYPL